MNKSLVGKILLGYSILFLIVFIFYPAKTNALNIGQTISIGPAIVSQLIQPGSTASGTINITNKSNGSYNFIDYVTPYSVQGENYDPTFIDLPNKPDISKWFHIYPALGVLAPGQVAAIKYTIAVPVNTPPGGYYAALFAQTNIAKQTGSSGILEINQRVGAVFYIQAAGPVNKQGSLVGWHTNFFQKTPITSSLRLQNTGDIHYISSISVAYQDIFGHVKYNYTAQKIVLPDTIRQVNISWPKSPSLGLFKVSGTVTIYGTVQLKTEYVLVISPIYIFIAAGIIALLIFLIVLRIIGRSKKRRKLSG